MLLQLSVLFLLTANLSTCAPEDELTVDPDGVLSLHNPAANTELQFSLQESTFPGSIPGQANSDSHLPQTALPFEEPKWSAVGEHWRLNVVPSEDVDVSVEIKLKRSRSTALQTKEYVLIWRNVSVNTLLCFNSPSVPTAWYMTKLIEDAPWANPTSLLGEYLIQPWMTASSQSSRQSMPKFNIRSPKGDS